MNEAAKIVETGKRMLKAGLVASTWGNLSIRRDADSFFITPSGMEYELLVEEDIVCVDSAGRLVAGTKKPSSETQLHAEIYKIRPDVGAIVHTHSIYATAFAVVEKEIPAIVEDMVMVVGGSVKVLSYTMPGSTELAKAAAVELQDKNALLLTNHGLVCLGKDMDEAYKSALLVEKTAQIAAIAATLGQPRELSAVAVAELRAQYLDSYGQKEGEK